MTDPRADPPPVADRPPVRTRRGRVSPDRLSVSAQRVWVLTALVGVMLWASLTSLPGGRGGTDRLGVAVQAATVCAVLAMFGLRSVPIRWIVRGLALMSGMLLARFGELGTQDGLQGSWRVLLWLAALGGALVLAPSSRLVPGVDPGTIVQADQTPEPKIHDAGFGGRAVGGGERPARKVRARGGVPTALIVAAVALIGASSLLIGPRAANQFPTGPSAGDLADLGDGGPDNALVARDTLDMTTRPRLSAQVVMSVRSPTVSFWRTETFDRWNGSQWTRSGGRSGRLVENGRVVSSPEDIAAQEGETTTQDFRLETVYATALPAAASAVRVETSEEIAQRADGTLWSPGAPVGRGTTYSVRSRQMPVDGTSLRDTGSAGQAAADGDDTAETVLARYAEPPQTTDRVRSLALRVTAGANNDFDRIRALEAWMGDNTTYSLEAPLAPRGVDVVDDFLFESQEGWCEQIASSLVVMARVAGVPARLATGFAPGEYDGVGGRFVVRERDAHAWAEVWFPETGWVPFDPTAEVPLSGTEEATAGADARDWREIAGAVLLLVGVIALAAGPLRRLVRRWSSKASTERHQRRAEREHWDAAAEAQLERIGAAHGRARRAAETVTVYSAAVGSLLDDERVGQVGVIVDRIRYGAGAGSDSASPDHESSGASVGPTDEVFVEDVLSSY